MQQALKEATVLQEIRTAYSKFIAAAPRQSTSKSFQWRAPAHRCEQTCDFFMHRNVVICKATHNWHYCTQITCDRMIRNHECQVCPLSGMAYDLEFEFDHYGVHHSADTHEAHSDNEGQEQPEADDYGDQTIHTKREDEQTTTAQDKPLPKRRKKKHTAATQEARTDEEKEKRIEEAEEQQAAEEARQDEPELQWRMQPSASPIETPQPLQKTAVANGGERTECERRIDMGNHEQRIATFESMMRKLFAKHLHTHASLCSTVAANAERLWILIQSSETISKKKHRYQTEYHLLVVAYNMCHGYNCMQREIVPLNEWIRANIPQVRDLKRMSGLAKSEVKVKNWTQASKMFKVCMTELVKTADNDITRRLKWVH